MYMAKFTKQAIYASFMKFLGEKPLGQITVKDIVDDCGINRKTFYYYYQDIYALAEESFRDRINDLKNDMPPESSTWFDILKSISNYMYENRKVTLHVFKSLGYEKMSNLFYDVCLEYLPPLIKKNADGLVISDSDMTLITHYASVALSGLLVRWIADGMKEVPVAMIDRFALIMDGTSRLALENADRISGK